MTRKAPRPKPSRNPFGTSLRADIVCAVAVTLLTALVWCAHYDRWTAQSWQTPITYLEDPVKADVLLMFAWAKAAEDGHISPVFFNNVPELGAPGTANWDDFPLPEKPLFLATGALAHAIGLFAASNASLLVAQVLAALGFFAAARLLNCSWPWAAAGALIFAFSRYEFAHGLHHITVTYAWHIPLMVVLWEWLFRGEVSLRGRNFVLAVLITVATAFQNIYYIFLFLQFVAMAGLYQAWRGGRRQALPALAVVGSTLVAGLLMNLNSILYELVHGAGGAVVRPYHWLEVYGLKLVDFVVPPADHPFPPFAAWGSGHMQEIMLSPGEMPPTAYLGVLGLAALAWLVVVSFRRVLKGSGLPLESYFFLWIILYSGVGGINSVLGSLGFDLFRATTRYSIVVLAIVLFFAARRLTALDYSRVKWLPAVAAFLAVVLALWDQMPPAVTDQDVARLAAEVASDRQFTAEMEQHLSPGAMVFQLPAMDFPEVPAPGVGPFDHFRPYLYAQHLRFSFGDDKGRPSANWQHQIGQLPIGAMVTELLSENFAAIYVNCNGYEDHGAGILATLKSMGYTDVIENDNQDLVCVPLVKKG